MIVQLIIIINDCSMYCNDCSNYWSIIYYHNVHNIIIVSHNVPAPF